MEEAETKQAALDQVFSERLTGVSPLIFAIIKVADLEEELGRVSERLTETEAEAMSQQVRIYSGFSFAISLNFKINVGQIWEHEI